MPRSFGAVDSRCYQQARSVGRRVRLRSGGERLPEGVWGTLVAWEVPCLVELAEERGISRRLGTLGTRLDGLLDLGVAERVQDPAASAGAGRSPERGNAGAMLEIPPPAPSSLACFSASACLLPLDLPPIGSLRGEMAGSKLFPACLLALVTLPCVHTETSEPVIVIWDSGRVNETPLTPVLSKGSKSTVREKQLSAICGG